MRRATEGAAAVTDVGVASTITWASLSAINSASSSPRSPKSGSPPTVPWHRLASSSAATSRPRGLAAAPLESITPTRLGEKAWPA